MIPLKTEKNLFIEIVHGMLMIAYVPCVWMLSLRVWFSMFEQLELAYCIFFFFQLFFYKFFIQRFVFNLTNIIIKYPHHSRVWPTKSQLYMSLYPISMFYLREIELQRGRRKMEEKECRLLNNAIKFNLEEIITSD